jgi:putative spermidine/putrescine transport system substrate-binding protein
MHSKDAFSASLFRARSTRRDILRAGAAAIAGVATSSFALPALAQSKPAQLVVADGGGVLNEAYKKGYYDTFTAKTGIQIVNAAYTGIGKLKAMVEAKNIEIDVLNIDAGEGALAAKDGLLEPLDWSLADRSSLMKGAAFDDFVASEVAPLVLSWNTQQLPDGPKPKDWSSLFDVDGIKGKRGLYKQASQTLEVVLLGLGVAPDKLYPLDVQRAFDALTKIRSSLTFWVHGAESAQLLISGETVLSAAWNGRLQGPKDDGAPVDFTFDNSLITSGAWIIPKGGKNTKWAQAFVAHVLDPKNQATAAEVVPYGPVVPKAYDLIAADRRKVLPDPSKGVWQDYNYWADNTDKIYAQFNDWMVR